MPGAGFDPARVVRLRIDADPGPFQFGSGYLVATRQNPGDEMATGMVLSAGHVLSLDDGIPPRVGAPCEVKPTHADWGPSTVAWVSAPALDLALVSVPQLGGGMAPTAWGMLAGTRLRQWRASGYPVASLEPAGRAVEDAWGTVSPVTLAEEKRFGLTVDSRVARPVEPNDGSGWAGLSGAAVFCGDALVGVITRDAGRYERSLIATRMEAVASDPGFAEALGHAPDARSVAGDLVQDIGNCRRRRRFDAILRREAVGFGGRQAELAALSTFLADPARSVLLVQAPAGYGKTALFANLVSDHGFPHAYHFFVEDDFEMATERGFLSSLVEQLEALLGLDAEAHADDVPWLQGRALELARRGHALVVDALDEAAFDATSSLRELRAAGLRTLVSRRWTGAESELAARDVLPLGGLRRHEIEDVLRAVGDMRITDPPTVAAEIERVAVASDTAFGGADPLMVRFLAEEAAAGEELLSEAPGIDDYFERWFARIRAAAGHDPAPLWVARLLASAKGPLGPADLEALVPAPEGTVFRPTAEDMAAPIQRHLIITDAGYRLAHPRLAELVRRRSDAAADAHRLLDYCREWQDNGSRYALAYLVKHLLDLHDDDAVWNLLASTDWYLAHLSAPVAPPVAGGERSDWLRWYLADIDALVQYAQSALDQRRSALVRLRVALMRSTFASIARRVPDDLFGLLAERPDGVAAALTLALRRTTAAARASALMAIASVVTGEAERVTAIREAIQTIGECAAEDRAHLLRALAPLLDPVQATDAASRLSDPLELRDIPAAIALGGRMSDPNYPAMLASIVALADDPLARALWRDELAGDLRGGLAIDAFKTACDALRPDATPPDALLDAGVLLVGTEPSLAQLVLDLIMHVAVDRRAELLGRLAEAGPQEAVVACTNELLKLTGSDERSAALALAATRLDDDDTRALLYRNWDVKELRALIPGLREPFRSEAGGSVIEYLRGERITAGNFEGVASIVGHIGPHLDGGARAAAAELLRQCAAVAPLVPPAEEMVREVMASLTITGPSGVEVVPEWTVGISRAAILTMLAQTETEAADSHIADALRATLAVGDAQPAALVLARLAGDDERIAAAAVDAALAIAWEGSLPDAVCTLAPLLPRTQRLRLGEAKARLQEFPDLAEHVELAVSACERPLSPEFIAALPDAVGRLDRSKLSQIVACAASELPDAVVEAIIEGLVQSTDDESDKSGLIDELARAGRLNLEQVLGATGGLLGSHVILPLLDSLSDDEREQLIEGGLDPRTSAEQRVAFLAALEPVVDSLPPALGERYHAELAALDRSDLSPTGLVWLARVSSEAEAAAITRRLLDERDVRNPNAWASTVTMLAPAAPTELLPDLLRSIDLAQPRPRAAAAAVSAQIEARGDDEMAHEAWTTFLGIAEHDQRSDLLEQLGAILPLAQRVLGQTFRTTIFDAVQQVREAFP